MSPRARHRFQDRVTGGSGTTLLETMTACGILTGVMAGLTGVPVIAMSITDTQGDLGALTHD